VPSAVTVRLRVEQGEPAAPDQAALAATVDSIAAVQLPSGFIPWFEGGHGDPWNHVEAAMALTVGGRRAEAEAAYAWLKATQRPDGAWHQYYRGAAVEEATLDANVTAYVATGVWHHFVGTRDRGFLEAMAPTVAAAIGFVLDLVRPDGTITWARQADGTPASFALLTASSSTLMSLRAASALAGVLDWDHGHWDRAARRLATAIATMPGAFAPKRRWAMDWYYPVMVGAVRGLEAKRHLAARRADFIVDGRGIRCVSDSDWVTTAETCECALAHLVAGERNKALELWHQAQHLRDTGGRYFTGMVHPQQVTFPTGERSTYGAAAAVLAADALWGDGPTASVLLDLGRGACDR